MENYEFPTIAKIDTDAPKFNLPFYDPKTDSDGKISSEDMSGKWTVLFYYPADFTFVCPTELKDMAEQEAVFKDM
jgi:peroxiredoxin (alkyl hydroperoxide reductase subunit C)